MTELEPYHYPRVYEQLLGFVKKHELKILHEDGLYRHLRFQTPGTSIGYYDIVTWPGSLAISGDIGEGFIFKREEDMIAWFGPNKADGHINAGYWSEKLTRGTREVREVFSDEKFKTYLDEQVEQFAKATGADLAAVRADVQASYESEYTGTTDFAYQFMEGLEYEGDRITPDIDDDSESWLEYDHHFLLACHAILWGIKKYTKEKTIGA